MAVPDFIGAHPPARDSSGKADARLGNMFGTGLLEARNSLETDSPVASRQDAKLLQAYVLSNE